MNNYLTLEEYLKLCNLDKNELNELCSNFTPETIESGYNQTCFLKIFPYYFRYNEPAGEDAIDLHLDRVKQICKNQFTTFVFSYKGEVFVRFFCFENKDDCLMVKLAINI